LIDRDFLLLFIKGFTSSYAIWSHIKKEAKEKGADNTSLKVMAYNNVNVRVTNLLREGFLEEVKIGGSIHGRKDFRLTNKGLEQLMPHVIAHPEDAKAVHAYMDRFNVDNQAFGKMLVGNVISNIDSENEYLVSMKRLGFAPTNRKQLRHVQDAIIGFHNKLVTMQNTLFAKELEKVSTRETRTGHKQKFTEKRIPHSPDEYFGQIQGQMERGELITSNSESDEEDNTRQKSQDSLKLASSLKAEQTQCFT
jgi:hypothetical protein